ncbi:hypothetical protein P7C73_g6045, partial [Tremellales sp. Uapishka_1]
MASLLQSTASAAHSTFASLASVSPIKAGDAVPDVDIKINDMEDHINFSKLTGKNVLVVVPGAGYTSVELPPLVYTILTFPLSLSPLALFSLPSPAPRLNHPPSFTPTCSSQVPSYVSSYDDFSKKGVKDIYVVSVNDICVVNAWKEKMLGDSKAPIKFAADDAGKFASGTGLVLDAQAILGGPRLKRGAIVIEDGKVLSVVVEPSPGEVTISSADEVLKTL